MIDFNKNEIIEKYLMGELRGDQLEAFENKLATDATLKNEVAIDRAIIRNLKKVGRSELRSKLENIHLEMGPELTLVKTEEVDDINPEVQQPNQSPLTGKVIKLTPQRYVLLAAASIALVIACTLTLQTINQSRNTPEAIFESYYEPYTDIAVTRDIPTNIAIKNEASLAYNAGDYRKSIQLFNILLEKEPDEIALFYLGNAYLSANMPLEAIKTFETYLEKYSEYQVEAKWYLSLSYLKANKNTKARKLLNDLVIDTTTPDPTYKDKAKEILNRFDTE